MIKKIIKFLVIHILDRHDDFLAFSFGRDEFTDYSILKITYDENGMKTIGTRDCRENEGNQKSIINDLAPKPLEPYIPETEESKRFHAVSEALSKAGIHGEENTIRTYEALGWSTNCGMVKEQK